MTIHQNLHYRGSAPMNAHTPSPLLTLSGISKSYDARHLAVTDVDLRVEKGEFISFLGPSGSGKTSTLMMVAGFETPSTGTIHLEGTNITELAPQHRGMGMVFQNYALFPHMTVAQNVAFPLAIRGRPRDEIAARVTKSLEMVHLGKVMDRKPGQLSGGQQQRVAIARALVFNPKLVLMDEPLGALDRQLREEMQLELSRLHRELALTVLYVTHDQSEAMTMSDRVAVFNQGRIVQLDTPKAIYSEPADSFVAGFVGDNNCLYATVKHASSQWIILELPGGQQLRAHASQPFQHGQQVNAFIRCEDLFYVTTNTPDQQELSGVVISRVFHGDHYRNIIELGSNRVTLKTARGQEQPAQGERCTFAVNTSSISIFPL
ncbi:ABC transporter ATP-binding protein [Rhizobium sp. BK609]|uniref:ABC transporter ATP-binding protein n=1 Tax=unclassified Rhizobium TaxID=2613769 RepID=UPI0017D6255E|nr:putative spermidine/putrescine transport system ATP-binding protein [Rhizobium sp. BK098]MBB3617928.1 putative spermidine/putrescine transport system ATP-binding protein [Rhizobium sp. BK609]MBB3683619.1 putative spermidine/putrescine transport system ATP-binding protein [Rhizobium sp. BK612]